MKFEKSNKLYHVAFIVCMFFTGLTQYDTIGEYIAEPNEDTIIVQQFHFGKNWVSFYYSMTGYSHAKAIWVRVNGGLRRNAMVKTFSDFTVYSVYSTDVIELQLVDKDSKTIIRKIIHDGRIK